MPESTLTALTGREIGSSSTRRLRSEGKIPGVVYGHGSDPIPVAVVAREFQIAMSGDAGLNTLLQLNVDGKDLLTMARDIQHHPVRNVVTHVDFLIVRRDEVISAEVPINLIGEAIEVQHGDGMVEQQLFSLSVRAVPGAIPNFVELDISELTIGAALRVADLALPEGVTTDIDVESIVVAGQPPRIEAAAGAEGEEGVAGAPAAGEAAEGEATPAGTNDEG